MRYSHHSIPQPRQLCFDFDEITPEEFEQLCRKLVEQAAQLRDELISYNIAFQRLKVNLEAIAGCSLEDWNDPTMMEYARLCIGIVA